MYNLFSKTLQGSDFEINPYDRCVENKVIESSQCTIYWYVDDKNLLHKNSEVISDIINEVKKHLGEISFVRGNKHNFLGFNIEINYNMIKVDMVEKFEECIEMFVE